MTEFSKNLARIDERSLYPMILVRGEELFASIRDAGDEHKETIEVPGSTRSKHDDNDELLSTGDIIHLDRQYALPGCWTWS